MDAHSAALAGIRPTSQFRAAHVGSITTGVVKTGMVTSSQFLHSNQSVLVLPRQRPATKGATVIGRMGAVTQLKPPAL